MRYLEKIRNVLGCIGMGIFLIGAVGLSFKKPARNFEEWMAPPEWNDWVLWCWLATIFLLIVMIGVQIAINILKSKKEGIVNAE